MERFSEAEIAKLQNNLSLIRKLAGWTTAELGDLIGVTKQTISNLENKKTMMTKTQYIAIRAILDCEISSSPDNIALAQVVEILLNAEDILETDQPKIETTMAYVAGAAENGMSSAAIVAGMMGLFAALGLTFPVFGAAIMQAPMPKWLLTIAKSNKKKN